MRTGRLLKLTNLPVSSGLRVDCAVELPLNDGKVGQSLVDLGQNGIALCIMGRIDLACLPALIDLVHQTATPRCKCLPLVVVPFGWVNHAVDDIGCGICGHARRCSGIESRDRPVCRRRNLQKFGQRVEALGVQVFEAQKLPTIRIECAEIVANDFVGAGPEPANPIKGW